MNNSATTTSAAPTRGNWRSDAVFLLPCLAVALLLRLYFFNGPSLFDDVNYWQQAIATGLDGAWPPERTHWHTRIGFILPCAALLKIFGLHVWVPYVFTMLGGLLEIVVTFYIARELVSNRVARLAAWLCVFFPLNILNSSYLFTDLWVGLIGATSLLFWHRALRSDRGWDYARAAFCFGVAWLFRETIVMCGPIYLALWLHAGRWRRPKMLWALPAGLVVLVAEMLLYQWTAGNWHYRVDAITASKEALIGDYAGSGNFLVRPVVRLFTNHECGLFLIAGLAVAAFQYRRLPTALALWLLVGFAWFSWGTTMPTKWVTLLNEPRYLSVLTIPCMTLLAVWVQGLRSSWWRGVVVGLLIASGFIAAAMDLGRAKLGAYRRFAQSEYNRPGVVLEPVVYFGVRAAQSFSPENVRFACASDWGRNMAVKLMPHLPQARLERCAAARYLVTTVQIEPEKFQQKLKEGWRVVAEFPGDKIFARELLHQVLARVRGRDCYIIPPPDLMVLAPPGAGISGVTP